MSQEPSKPEKPVEEWRRWSPARKKRFKATMAAKRRAKKVTRRVKLDGPRKVPLFIHTLAKQVRRAAINFLHDGEGGEDLAVNALLLARKVMEGE